MTKTNFFIPFFKYKCLKCIFILANKTNNITLYLLNYE